MKARRVTIRQAMKDKNTALVAAIRLINDHEKAEQEKREIVTFKTKVNSEHPITKGYERAFCQCKESNRLAYYDFVPYSLSNPIIVTPCFHDFKHSYKSI